MATTILRAVIDASGLSRRKAFEAIRSGHVSLDGQPAVDPSSTYARGVLRLDGVVLKAPKAAKAYLMLNKPPGYVTTVEDDLGRQTVLDLLPPDLKAPGLHPVGRLDRDTSGLLLLTNDGDLTYVLTHPKYEVEKEYWLRLAEPPTDAQVAEVRRGVEIDGEIRRPVRLRRLNDGRFDMAVTLREGRRRQVRRMFEAVGGRPTQLRRVREGPLQLGSLAEGAVRPLTPAELKALRGEALVVVKRRTS